MCQCSEGCSGPCACPEGTDCSGRFSNCHCCDNTGDEGLGGEAISFESLMRRGGVGGGSGVGGGDGGSFGASLS